jgi:lipoprotein NlpD
VQDRSPLIPHQVLAPTTSRATAGPAAAPPRAAAAVPVVPRPAQSATAGLTPPEAVAPVRADDPVAVATPLRGDAGVAAASPGAAAASPGAATGGMPRERLALLAPDHSSSLPELAWTWPVDTPISQAYSETRKGVDFAGALGQPVRAAAAGVVSYVGNSLRGYGRMVVIKHDKGYLSVYAHNREILVKEGDRVERGQRVAEMGNSDSSEVVLHFELRHQGKPLDPSQILPGR